MRVSALGPNRDLAVAPARGATRSALSILQRAFVAFCPRYKRMRMRLAVLVFTHWWAPRICTVGITGVFRLPICANCATTTPRCALGELPCPKPRKPDPRSQKPSRPMKGICRLRPGRKKASSRLCRERHTIARLESWARSRPFSIGLVVLRRAIMATCSTARCERRRRPGDRWP